MPNTVLYTTKIGCEFIFTESKYQFAVVVQRNVLCLLTLIIMAMIEYELDMSLIPFPVSYLRDGGRGEYLRELFLYY